MTKTITLLSCFLLVATAALAMSLQEISSATSSAASDAASLASLIDACPGGTCSGAAALIDALDDLEAEHASLVSELDQISPCTGCAAAGSALADVEDELDAMRVIVVNWEEQ